MFLIRNCIDDPLINVIPSNIDNCYYIEIRNFLNNNIRNFINDIDLKDKKVVDIGLTGHIKEINNLGHGR